MNIQIINTSDVEAATGRRQLHGLWTMARDVTRNEANRVIKKVRSNNMLNQSNITCIGSTKDLRSDFDQIEG